MSSVAHYCQKCRAANSLGEEFCARCGTRLMIIVEPAAARYETAEAAVSNEEHLLERISALENRLTRLTGRLERGLDLLLRHAQNSHFDRALVKSLVGVLTDDGIVQSERLERVWMDRCKKDVQEQQETERREELRLKILARYDGPERQVFEKLITEGFLFIDDELGRGSRSLQRAAEMSANNSELLYFLGEHFFKKGKTARAREYLSRAYEVSTTDKRVSLLLGLTCADEGDIERAKELLNNATRLGGSSFAAHYGLGRIFVAEAKWGAALQEFKLALASKESPEAHYALGCLYYQLCRDSLAVRHLRKAFEMDGGYDEAAYLLELISKRAGKKPANQYRQNAATPSRHSTTELSSGVKPQQRADRMTAPLFRQSSTRPRRLITGDRRLAEALRQDALHACNTPKIDGR